MLSLQALTLTWQSACFTSLSRGSSPAPPHLGLDPFVAAKRGAGPLASPCSSPEHSGSLGGCRPTPREGKPTVPSRGMHLVSGTSKTQRPGEGTRCIHVMGTLSPAAFLVDQVPFPQVPALVGQGRHSDPLTRPVLEGYTSCSKETPCCGEPDLDSLPYYSTEKHLEQLCCQIGVRIPARALTCC